MAQKREPTSITTTLGFLNLDTSDAGVDGY
jgi:hypothetical protein